MLSLNHNALELVKDMILRSGSLNLAVSHSNGATIIDAGVNTSGGLEAARRIIEICMAGLGRAAISSTDEFGVMLNEVYVTTDQPSTALLGSQLAAWNFKTPDYKALVSGPARVLAKKPKKLYEELGLDDKASVAVAVLEADSLPSGEAIKSLAGACAVDVSSLYAIVAPAGSIAGCVQIAGRSAETFLHKIHNLGLNPNAAVYVSGVAPAAPPHPDPSWAMGLTNDMLLYGSRVQAAVRFDDDERLEELVEKSPSSASDSYGRPFKEIYEEAGRDFYKIDRNLFSPSMVSVYNLTSGKMHTAGRVAPEIIRASLQNAGMAR
jgi:methenyltetrahydromethanopterin cyclohydrolase